MGLQTAVLSSRSSWPLGGASLSRLSAASYMISRTPSSFLFARASSSSDKSKSSLTASESGTFLLPPEDVRYVVKLTVGSVSGAAAVKYGSLLLPSITEPNFVEALLIMGLPVIVAVIWLAFASFKHRSKT